MKFCWWVTLIATIGAAIFMFFGLISANSAAQESAVAAISVGMVVIPYIFTRAVEGIDAQDVSPETSGGTRHRFKRFLDDGRRLEYKGNYSAALDSFQDAMFHLDHDYADSDYHEKTRVNEHKQKLTLMIHELEMKMAKANAQ